LCLSNQVQKVSVSLISLGSYPKGWWFKSASATANALQLHGAAFTTGFRMADHPRIASVDVGIYFVAFAFKGWYFRGALNLGDRAGM